MQADYCDLNDFSWKPQNPILEHFKVIKSSRFVEIIRPIIVRKGLQWNRFSPCSNTCSNNRRLVPSPLIWQRSVFRGYFHVSTCCSCKLLTNEFYKVVNAFEPKDRDDWSRPTLHFLDGGPFMHYYALRSGIVCLLSIVSELVGQTYSHRTPWGSAILALWSGLYHRAGDAEVIRLLRKESLVSNFNVELYSRIP